MKRNAFTLVELMVVIAILALLVAMLVPSMSSVMSLTRSTLCQNNLQKLGEAFTIASATRVVGGSAGLGTGSNEVVHPYPDAMLWPGTPKNSVADITIFTCPEEESKEKKGSVLDMFRLLEYRNEYGSFTMDNVGSKAYLYIARGGVDPEMGAFTEFLLQDDNNNGQYEIMGFNTWWDTDGYVRIYHSGYCWVPAQLPPQMVSLYPGAGGPGFPNRLNSCGDQNQIWFRGKPAFGTNAQVSQYRGQKDRPGYKLFEWTPWITNYGISSAIQHYPYGTRALVLVDYPELIADLEDPLEVEANLAKSARHLGKLNGLWGDGSVSKHMPIHLSPRLNRKVWEPPEVAKKPI